MVLQEQLGGASWTADELATEIHKLGSRESAIGMPEGTRLLAKGL